MKISEILPMLTSVKKAGLALAITGDAGIGKSAVVKQYAKMNNMHIEDLRLGNQEIGDLIGMPHNVERDGVVVEEWSTPSWLHRMNKAAEEGKECILFLDEFNRPQPDVEAATLQLVLDRQIHQHKLPVVNGVKTLVVAAMNPSDEDGGRLSYNVKSLDPAVSDRLIQIEMDADAEEWIAHAKEKKLSPVVIDFIIDNPEFIYNVPETGRISTPRSLEGLCHLVEQFTPGYLEPFESALITGQIGESLASRFTPFYLDYKSMLSTEDIIKMTNDMYKEAKTTKAAGELFSKYMQDENMDVLFITEKAKDIASLVLRPNIDAKSVTEQDKTDAIPLLVLLWGLPLETLSGVLHSLKSEKPELYETLAEVEKATQPSGKKELFIQLFKLQN